MKPNASFQLKPSRVVIYLILVIAVVFYLMPVYLLLATSLKSYSEVNLDSMWNFLTGLHFDCFRQAWFGEPGQGHAGTVK